jgi:adenosylmethionine-8-amino-7-oxononanoate aminotransferase
MGRQFFWSQRETSRINYIACKPSYHGNTLGALSLGFHKQRREVYEGILPDNMHHVSACDPYSDRKPDQIDEEYFLMKQEELINMFESLGGDTVIAFVVEPVAGAVGFGISLVYLLGHCKPTAHRLLRARPKPLDTWRL